MRHNAQKVISTRLRNVCAAIVFGALPWSPAFADGPVSNAPIMLAAGERLGVFDVAQPGLQFEILAPRDRALSLDSILTALGKNGLAGAIGVSRKSANAVVIDATGQVQLKTIAPAVEPAVVQGGTNQILVTSGLIVLDRGKVSIFADQLPQPGKSSGALQTAGVLNPVTTNIVPNLVNNLSPTQVAPASGAPTLATGIPQVAPLTVAPATPNYSAQVTINGINQGLVNLSTLTIPANATNVTITSTSSVTIPNNFTVPGATSLTIVSPNVSMSGAVQLGSGSLSINPSASISVGGNVTLNSNVVISPLQAAPVSNLGLSIGSSAGITAAGALTSLKPGTLIVQSGSGTLNSSGGITTTLSKTPLTGGGITLLPGK